MFWNKISYFAEIRYFGSKRYSVRNKSLRHYYTTPFRDSLFGITCVDYPYRIIPVFSLFHFRIFQISFAFLNLMLLLRPDSLFESGQCDRFAWGSRADSEARLARCTAAECVRTLSNRFFSNRFFL